MESSPTFSLQNGLPDRSRNLSIGESIDEGGARASAQSEVRHFDYLERLRRRRRAKKQARETRTGLATFFYIGSKAIERAANTEPDPDVRWERRRVLLRKWRNYKLDLWRLSY